MTGHESDEDAAFERALAMNGMLGEYRRNAITAGRYRTRVRAAYPSEYFDTRFRAETPLDWGSSNFAIISACATTGTLRDAAREAADDTRLHARLQSFGCSPRRVTGYSPHTGHAEASWAAPIGEIEAVRVGAEFSQDAIYLVRGGTLWVAACRDDRAPTPVGPLGERVDMAVE